MIWFWYIYIFFLNRGNRMSHKCQYKNSEPTMYRKYNCVFVTKIQKISFNDRNIVIMNHVTSYRRRAVDVKVNLIKGPSVVIYQGCLAVKKKKIKNYNSSVMTSFTLQNLLKFTWNCFE